MDTSPEKTAKASSTPAEKQDAAATAPKSQAEMSLAERAVSAAPEAHHDTNDAHYQAFAKLLKSVLGYDLQSSPEEESTAAGVIPEPKPYMVVVDSIPIYLLLKVNEKPVNTNDKLPEGKSLDEKASKAKADDTDLYVLGVRSPSGVYSSFDNLGQLGRLIQNGSVASRSGDTVVHQLS